MQSFFTQATKTLIRLCDAPTDLSLHWTHMSEGTFSDFAATTCLPTTVLTMRMKPSRMNPFIFCLIFQNIMSVRITVLCYLLLRAL